MEFSQLTQQICPTHVNLVVPGLTLSRCRLKMLTQLAGLNRFQIQPATFARSAAHAQYRVPAVYIYIYIYRDSASVESTRGGSLTLAPTSRMLEHYGASVSEVADNTEARSQ